MKESTRYKKSAAIAAEAIWYTFLPFFFILMIPSLLIGVLIAAVLDSLKLHQIEHYGEGAMTGFIALLIAGSTVLIVFFQWWFVSVFSVYITGMFALQFFRLYVEDRKAQRDHDKSSKQRRVR